MAEAFKQPERQSIGSAVVDVPPGDYFELIARQTFGVTKKVAADELTWFTIEVVGVGKQASAPRMCLPCCARISGRAKEVGRFTRYFFVGWLLLGRRSLVIHAQGLRLERV
jgi:hypothetical protein